MDYYRFLAALRQLDLKASRQRPPALDEPQPNAIAGEADTAYHAGLACLQSGDAGSALSHWRHALRCPITELALLHAIGDGLRGLGHDPAAIYRDEGATAGAPTALLDGHERTWRELCGDALRERWQAVAAALDDEQASFHGKPADFRNLAFALARAGDEGRAQCAAAAALAADGDWRAAADAFEKAPPAEARSARFLSCWFEALRHCGEDERAAEIAEQAAAQGTCDAPARVEWASALLDLTRPAAASAVLRAGATGEGDAGLRVRARLLLPPVPASQADLDRAHARLRRGVAALRRAAARASPEARAAFFDGLQPLFYLGYGGKPTFDIVREYGRFVSEVVAARYPDYCQPLALRSRGSAIRVGFASLHVTHHTITRHFGSWISAAGSHEIESHLFPLAPNEDAMSRFLGARVDVCHPAAGDFAAIASAIRGADLDILVYLSVGMDATSLPLAAMRLAPVQCVAWGHPVSTGLPSIDYFLSAEAMEPDNAQAHYTERLITLPGLGTALPAIPPTTAAASREALGIPARATVYLSPQSLFKYLPCHDGLYAQIAREVEDALFVFMEGDLPAWTRTFRARIAASFHASGLDPDRHLRFLPQCDLDHFHAMMRCCDVMLDTIGWSGGQTSYDALACGLPIVTLPGTFMRGRQTYGMLRQIGVEDTIANTVEEYVHIAVRLGRDHGWRENVGQRIAAGKHRLFDDHRPIEALESFYRWAAGGAQPEDARRFRLWPPASATASGDPAGA